MKYIEPHTPKWFALLMYVNPKQAAMVVKVMETVDNGLVFCTICGEKNCKVYRTCDNPIPTIRLCTDCLKIQVDMYGGKFEALPPKEQTSEEP
jgi:hypothetical protein